MAKRAKPNRRPKARPDNVAILVAVLRHLDGAKAACARVIVEAEA